MTWNHVESQSDIDYMVPILYLVTLSSQPQHARNTFDSSFCLLV